MKELIYRSNSSDSITSLSTFIKGETNIYLEQDIVHLFTEPVYNTELFYDTEYNISINSFEEDQLYSFDGKEKKYRIEHQIDQLIKKIEIKENSKILDYGCAKGSAMQHLVNRELNLNVFLYDVSEQYKPYWKTITKEENCFTYQIPSIYENSFDIITSFFVLEHVLDPLDIFKHCHQLLKDDGVFYFIVPNVYSNFADFLLVDHTHHFSENSLAYYLAQVGFSVQEIDNESHNGAFIVIAKKTNQFSKSPKFEIRKAEDALLIANYWVNLKNVIKHFCENNSTKRIAIYGAGVYGNYVFSMLDNTENVICFIDQNKFLHHKTIKEKQILYPSEIIGKLEREIDVIFVALNPISAKKSIESIPEFFGKSFEFFYL